MGGIYNSLNLNPYAYAHQNPLRYTDPSGAMPHPDDFNGNRNRGFSPDAYSPEDWSGRRQTGLTDFWERPPTLLDYTIVDYDAIRPMESTADFGGLGKASKLGKMLNYLSKTKFGKWLSKVRRGGDKVDKNVKSIKKLKKIEIRAGRYKHGGGGINIYKDGKRRFAIEVNKFKHKGKLKTRLHYHRGKTKNQIKKHRPYQGGW